MAALLYRIGRFSARRAWLVLVAWLALLGIVGGAYVAFAGTMTSAITIPGTPTGKVTDMLEEKFPEAAGGTGTIVIQSANGTPLTAAQQATISDTLARIGALDGVASVLDPFEVDQERQVNASQLEQGQAQAEEAQQQLDSSQQEVDANAAALDQAQTELDAQIAAAQDAGNYEDYKATLDEQQATIDASRKQLADGQQQIDEGSEQLAAQEPALAAGATLLDAAAGIRTVSESGNAAIAHVQFTDEALHISQDLKDEIAADLAAASTSDLRFYPSNDIVQDIPEILGVAEIVGVVIAAIVLLVMLGTAIAAALPIISALVGVAVATTATLALTGVIDFLSVTPVLGVMLGLAVGIDYSLFILNRHRKQLKAGVELHESIGLANGTSGNAVAFAGSTVIVALLGLNLTGIPFLALMGNVAAVAVLVAILIAVTFTPAALSLIGMRALRRKERATIGHEDHHRETDKPMRTGRAIATLIAATVGLGVIAIPAASMRLGLPDGASEPVGSAAYEAHHIMTDEFGAGTAGPLLIVASVADPVTEDAVPITQAAITTQLMAFDDVTAVAPVGVSGDGTVLAFQLIPNEGPNAESTVDLVDTLRAANPLDVDGQNVTIGVAGSTSAAIDVSEKLADVLPMYLTVVVGLSLIILMIAFRSILVPLIASFGFVLSLLATFGGITAIYQWGWLSQIFDVHAPGPILAFLPVVTIGILFGLAMDYQLFISAGMRESYAHGAPARIAVMRGFHAGRSVVTAAAIIMISVFGGFIFAESHMIRAIGFGLAFGVLLDAFVVRMTIIPAAMHLLGDKAWWIPKWLDRILPDADIEGTKLERDHPLPVSKD